MKLRLLLAPSSLLLAIVACSGASSTELFGPPGSTQLGAEPGTSNGDGSSGTVPGSSGSSGDLPPSASSSGTSGSSSSGSTSGGTSSGGPKDAGTDAASPKAATIYCGGGPGAKKCTAGAEVCCGSWFGRGSPTYECEPAGLIACAVGTSIACDDKTDCPNGQVCCGTLEENSGYTSVECRNKCNNFGGLRAVRFCDPNAANDECAAIGMYCGPSQSLPGYYVCRD